MKFRAVATEAFDQMNIRKSALFQSLKWPFVFLFLLNLIETYGKKSSLGISFDLLDVIFLGPLNIIFYAVVAIRIHKVLILEENTMLNRRLLSRSKNPRSKNVVLISP